MARSYYCGVCRTSSPPSSRTEAERERDRHRDQVHGGRIPDGEQIRTAERETFNVGEIGKAGLFVFALLVADWMWRHF